MAIIDPDGLFCGERLAACSDMAKLYWPRFFLASNGYGRLELSYKSLVSRVFGNFQKIPESSEIWQIFREYEANFLAVLYESSDGCWWCQFITSEKYLPKYKKTRDNDSPAPTFEQMEKSRMGYLAWKKANSFSNQSFQKVLESFVRRGEERRGFGIGAERSGVEWSGEGKEAPRSGGGNGAPAPAAGFSLTETPASVHDQAEFIATAVIDSIGVTTRWGREQIVQQAELKLRTSADTDKPFTMDELRDGMILQWKRFKECVRQNKLVPAMKYMSAEKFFGEGIWENSKEWGLKKGMSVDGIVV